MMILSSNLFYLFQVIPNLVKSLAQDVKARSVIIKSLSAIRDLSITIQRAGVAVKESRGSFHLCTSLMSILLIHFSI